MKTRSIRDTTFRKEEKEVEQMEFKKKILVIGSLNMDLVVETPHMPKAGETITGKSITNVLGGKGANQAYAAGKLGGNVGMIGAVGNDACGRALKQNLECVHVDTSGIEVLENEMSGQAFITVDDNGENAIIIIAGTNGMVTKEMIQKHIKKLKESNIIIMQMEIPVETVEYVKDLASKLGKLVIIDPAPAVSNLPDSFFQGVDYMKPNETELEILTGIKIQSQEQVTVGARNMLERGVKNVIITLGSKGCLLVTEDGEEFFPAKKVRAVDTTAAGDSFTAAFALALSEGKNSREAIQFAQKVSAIAVTRKGAQTSIPTRAEADRG